MVDTFFALNDLDGNNGFAIAGINTLRFADEVSNAGDINGDSFDDFIIGASSTSVSGSFSVEGKAYVIFGRENGFDANFNLASLNGKNDFEIQGLDKRDRLEVNSAGDINERQSYGQRRTR